MSKKSVCLVQYVSGSNLSGYDSGLGFNYYTMSIEFNAYILNQYSSSTPSPALYSPNATSGLTNGMAFYFQIRGTGTTSWSFHDVNGYPLFTSSGSYTNQTSWAFSQNSTYLITYYSAGNNPWLASSGVNTSSWTWQVIGSSGVYNNNAIPLDTYQFFMLYTVNFDATTNSNYNPEFAPSNNTAFGTDFYIRDVGGVLNSCPTRLSSGSSNIQYFYSGSLNSYATANAQYYESHLFATVSTSNYNNLMLITL